ncbi:MAG: hypothetical protein WD963_02500 [Candidatus Paceibacterota bacterium]
MRIIDQESTSGKIIYALGIGIGISVALANRRTSYKITKTLVKEIFGKNEKPPNLPRRFSKLRQQKLVAIKKIGEEDHLVLTEKGETILLRFDYENIEIKKSKIWDRHFRMVVFDIPEKRRKERDLFRFKLKEMEFVKFNDSVWMYPYPCQGEIDFVANYLGIGTYVHFALVKDITNKEKLERYFKL